MRSGLLCTSLLLWGCAAVGPDYAPPPMTVPIEFDNAVEDLFVSTAPTGELWRSLNDPTLDQLIARALTSNTDIAIAVARMDESRALRGLTRYSWFPTVTASSSADRNRASDEDPFAFPGLGVIDIYRFGFDSTWEIDLFGSLRRQAERIQRIVQADEATLHDLQRTIVGEVAQSYFTLRGAQAQLAVQRTNQENQARSVSILQSTLDAGRGTALDVARARSLERTVAAAIPATEATVALAQQRLAVLTAQPSADLADPLSSGALPVMPEVINIGTPQDWLRRRPDVRAAERQLAAATSGIGVEVAEYYPKLSLDGSFGYNGADVAAFGDDNARRWRFGPVLSWRFLDFGRVKRNVMAAQAREREAIAVFQGVLLRALEDMESALVSYRTTSQTALAVTQALAASTQASDLARLRFENGASNYLEVLDAERTRLELADQHAQALTARATALTAVYKALAAD
ncbi:MAG: efflux transporter outer membrane subunit [Gammaproteobacteria bacterium]